MSIDPRLIDRRRSVAEDNAKRNVRRLLRFLAVVMAVAAVVWVAYSPWLSVDIVETDGVAASSTHAILTDHGVVAGSPMVTIDAGAVERALLADPWVREAVVGMDWPDRVSVEVVERAPVAWTNTASGWTRRAIDGVALPSAETPDEGVGQVDMTELGDEEAETSPEMLGALTFLAALPADLHGGTVVTVIDDELWATVSGYQVRLGRPVEMTEKALSLAALVAKPIPEGSTLVLIAPTNPATRTPSADNGEDTDD